MISLSNFCFLCLQSDSYGHPIRGMVRELFSLKWLVNPCINSDENCVQQEPHVHIPKFNITNKIILISKDVPLKKINSNFGLKTQATIPSYHFFNAKKK